MPQWASPVSKAQPLGQIAGCRPQSVDSRETTIDHIGEISIPILILLVHFNEAILKIDDIKGDLYDLVNHKVQARTSDAAVTLFKNGGGAHLDLMIARHILTLVGKG